ncbi:MAG: twin-arginine translocation signal domain-containing protein [Desulfobacterales bacterium]|nr:MAG: twin-arginine translocation signal domain-containing protein [Desulfobacterales bacterium]
MSEKMLSRREFLRALTIVCGSGAGGLYPLATGRMRAMLWMLKIAASGKKP